jgi:hypothetical protein
MNIRLSRGLLVVMMLGSMFVFSSPVALSVPPSGNVRAVDYAAGRAAAQLWERLVDSQLRELRIAFLPLFNDGSDGVAPIYPVVRAELASQTGRHSFFTRDEAEWNRLIGEISFGASRADVMDAATIQRFGAVKGVEALLYGEVREASSTADGAGVVRLTLFLAEVATGQQLWSGNIEGAYAPVAENRPPVAEFTFDQPSPVVDQRVRLRDVSTDPDGEITARGWDLDGSGSFDQVTTVEVDWVFRQSGQHPISLRVLDDRGAEAIARGIIVVTEAERELTSLDRLLAAVMEHLAIIIAVVGVLLVIVVVWRLGSRPR